MTAKYYAFFDVDGTVIRSTSMVDFLDYSFPRYYGLLGFYGKLRAKLYALKRKKFSSNKTREQLNYEYYQLYKSMNVDKVSALGYKWFNFAQANNDKFFNEKVLKEIQYHQEQEATIVLVSGAFLPCLQPIADYLGIQHILCVNPVIKNNRYTGHITEPQTIGSGKKQAVIKFLPTTDYSILERSYAYGDHISDLPLLELVGNPVVVCGDDALEKHAINQAWKLI